MNNTFSWEQIAKTGNINADLIMRQYNWDRMTKFMKKNSINSKTGQTEIAKEKTLSFSTLQRYRRELILFSPYRTHPTSTNFNTRKQKTSNHTENDLKVTSNDLKVTSNGLKKTSNSTNENGKK